MKIQKALLLVLCAVLVISATAYGTLAYFSDFDQVTNTFAVGKIGLRLDEAKVNEMGEPDGTRWTPSERDPKQEYYLLPGHSYTKDPTVTVNANSEECHVRMMVTVTYKKEADAVFTKFPVEQWLEIHSDWSVSGDPETTETETHLIRTYEFRYKETVAKSAEETELPPLFAAINVPGGVSTDEIASLNDMNISVIAHAMQDAGFNGDANAAWAAFDGQVG